ncbi:hypothetical protein ACJZ2D_014146 [Fusarium nematophilum]
MDPWAPKSNCDAIGARRRQQAGPVLSRTVRRVNRLERPAGTKTELHASWIRCTAQDADPNTLPFSFILVTEGGFINPALHCPPGLLHRLSSSEILTGRLSSLGI